MTHIAPPPQQALGGFAAELCAKIAADHPLLAILLQPLLDHLRRIAEVFDRLFAAFQAGNFAPVVSAPTRSPLSVPAPGRAARRVASRAPRRPHATPVTVRAPACQWRRPAAPMALNAAPFRSRDCAPAGAPPALPRFFTPSDVVDKRAYFITISK